MVLPNVGDVRSTHELARIMIRATREASTGRAAFVDLGDVTVRFTITPGGTNVHVRGLGEDEPELELVIADGVGYRREKASDGFWDTWPMRRRWAVGDPLALIESLADGDAVVVQRSGELTTYRIATSFLALSRFCGVPYADPADAGPEDAQDRLWVVDDAGLLRGVHAVGDAVGVLWDRIVFSDWGSTPAVTAPASGSPEVEVDPVVAPVSAHEGEARRAFAEQVGMHVNARDGWEDAFFIAGSHPFEGGGASRRIQSRLWLVGPTTGRAGGRGDRLVLEGRPWIKVSAAKLNNSPKFDEAVATRALAVDGKSQNLLIVHFSRHDGHARGRAQWGHHPDMETYHAVEHLDDAAWVRAAVLNAGIALP
jgi:hypothetical protein